MVDVRLKISIVTSTSYKQLQAVTNNQYLSFDSTVMIISIPVLSIDVSLELISTLLEIILGLLGDEL